MPFLDENHLLSTDLARTLYHGHAAKLPVVDPHTHLCPRTFAGNAPFTEIADLWIASDPYKHRAMRMAGVPEARITGDPDPADRFAAWAATLPLLVGNPLYTWSHLELQRFFGVTDPLDADSAERVREICNARLKAGATTPRALLSESNVRAFATSDSWEADLEEHRATRDQPAPHMLPSLRGDAALACDAPGFGDWVRRMEQAADSRIRSLDDLLRVLGERVDLFHAAGCRIADHSPDALFCEETGAAACESLFERALAGPLSRAEAAPLQTRIFVELCREYHRRGWALQLHVGAQRATSTRLREQVGKAGGYAGIGPPLDIGTLTRLLDRLEQADALPRTILYPLNPSDFEAVAVLAGSFPGDGIRGNLQLGPAWWFNDHRDGIERQLRALAAYGLLGGGLGMVSDSRSFLSGVRHECYRRILCRTLGQWAAEGEAPADPEALAPLLRALCYENAAQLCGVEPTPTEMPPTQESRLEK